MVPHRSSVHCRRSDILRGHRRAREPSFETLIGPAYIIDPARAPQPDQGSVVRLVGHVVRLRNPAAARS
jgi:hypothetical protein